MQWIHYKKQLKWLAYYVATELYNMELPLSKCQIKEIEDVFMPILVKNETLLSLTILLLQDFYLDYWLEMDNL